MKGFYEIKPLLQTSQRIFENNSVIIHLYTTAVVFAAVPATERAALPSFVAPAAPVRPLSGEVHAEDPAIRFARISGRS